MRLERPRSILLVLALCCAWVGLGQAQGPDGPRPPDKGKVPEKPKTPEKPKAPEKAKTPEPPRAPEAPTTPEADPFAQASRGGEAPGRGFVPNVLGDLFGVFGRQLVTLPTVQTINAFQPVVKTTTGFQVITIFVDGVPQQVRVPVRTTTTTLVPFTFTVPGTITVPFAVAVSGVGAFKITENESPIPQDRIFLTGNYYDHIRGPNLAGDLSHPETQTTINGFPAVVTTTVPPFTPPFINATREILGFEKTFLGGMGSVELRAPFVEQQGDGSFSRVGDLTGVVKLALLSDPGMRNVLSVGLAVTAPTGPSIPTVAGDAHSTLLQPFLGWRLSQGPCWVQGFSSVAAATNPLFPTLLFNDVSAGCMVYRGPQGAAISQVSPVVEAHLTTPLTQRGANSPIVLPDLLVLVGGVQVGLFGPSTLTLGVGTPVTGPRLFNVEAIAQLNWRF